MSKRKKKGITLSKKKPKLITTVERTVFSVVHVSIGYAKDQQNIGKITQRHQSGITRTPEEAENVLKEHITWLTQEHTHEEKIRQTRMFASVRFFFSKILPT